MIKPFNNVKMKRMRVLDHLLKAVCDAAVSNPEAQVAPICILWPDRGRKWETAIPVLQAELPELMTLAEKRAAQQHEAQT